MSTRTIIIGIIIILLLIGGGYVYREYYQEPVASPIIGNETETGENIVPSSISWTEAVTYLENCEVTMALQTHDRQVRLTLQDKREVVATEPVIDDLFKVTERTREKCGVIPIATE